MEGGGETKLDLIDKSGMEAAWIVTQMDPPAHALTAIVKGTFRLSPDEIAILSDEQRPLTGDEYDGGDPAASLRYPMDFAPFKPRADVLLVGTCHAPGGQPALEVPVTFRVGSNSKSLVVSGERIWTGRVGLPIAAPFLSVPLNWEFAYGGPGFDRNPLGRGFASIKLADGTTSHQLPLIELPNNRLRSPRDKVDPAGFGPIDGMWPQRISKFGSYNDRYLKERWPWYPHNFDWAYFNVAPEDQQIDSYLRGGEEILAENVHPDWPSYRAWLPGLRVRCFMNERVKAHEEFREIGMFLDTLWIDMDAETLMLVWRGHIPVISEKLYGAKHFFVMAESLSDAPASAEECRQLLFEELKHREEADEELEPETEEVEEVADEDDEVVVESEDEEEPGTAAAPQVDLASLPVPITPPPSAEPLAIEPDEEPDEPEVEEEEDDAEAETPDDEDVLTSVRVSEMIAARQSFDGCDLSKLDLADFDFQGLSMREAILEGTVLIRANLSGTDLSGAILASANLCNSKCVGAIFSGADLTEAWLTHADLSRADLTGADLTGARLRFAMLRGSKAAETVFEHADLSDANCEEADLSGSDLCHSRLHRTDFTRANLSDAAIEKAWGRNVRAVGANVERLRGAKAVLTLADFSESHGLEAVFEFADLHGVSFARSSLNQAEFSSAYLGNANFDAATIKEARFNEACMRHASMFRCNLYEASLEKADLTLANLSESNLFGATLIDTVIEKTNFYGANLRRIKSREEIRT